MKAFIEDVITTFKHLFVSIQLETIFKCHFCCIQAIKFTKVNKNPTNEPHPLAVKLKVENPEEPTTRKIIE